MMESIRRDDYGFFGPDSPSWKVWASPTSLIGFQRAVVLEHFDLFLAAAVADSAGIYTDPTGRLDRTLAYFLTVAVADGRTAVSVSDALMRIHARVKGIEPITGTRYSANNPDAQLWIHVTGWHSVLKCYERYGPGPLSAAEESRYWAESRIAAELQTCKPADVPASRDECGSTSPMFAAGSALLNTPTAQCITYCGRRATEARGCGRAAGFSRLPRSRPCRDGCGTWAISISPPQSTSR